MKPFLTLTGIDERTDLSVAKELAGDGVEFGILLSASPEGRHRYPSVGWIENAAASLREHCAVHICGRIARERLLNSGYDAILDQVGRIQVNGKVSVDELDWLCPHFREQKIITQLAGTPADYLDIHEGTSNHEVLVDASGGRGITPREWVNPKLMKRVGYAGGLYPNNVRTELAKIANVADSDWWIDMESSLRSDADWFHLIRARDVIEMVREFRGNMETPPPTDKAADGARGAGK